MSSCCAQLFKHGFPLRWRTTTTCSLFVRWYASRPFTTPLPFAVALSSAARAAAARDDLPLVESIHAAAVVNGLHYHVVVATSILDAYSKCGDLSSSRKVFDAMPHRNAVSWNALIAGYTNAGMGISALELFVRMKSNELAVAVNEYTVSSCVTASAGISDAVSGAQIHGYAVKLGFEEDHAVASSLANMYFRCGHVESARKAMKGRENDCLRSKFMMINGYVVNGRYFDALDFVVRNALQNLAVIVMIDFSILISILTICAQIRLLRVGKQVHALIITLGTNKFGSSNYSANAVLWSALINMYCKCSRVTEARYVFDRLHHKHASCWNSLITGHIHNGLLEEARQFFDNMQNKDVITWTAMISGYVQNGLPQEGLRLMANLQNGGGGLLHGNTSTFAVALDACSCLAALACGKQIHAQAVRTGAQFGLNSVVLETALIDMYSKSGNLKYARIIFDQMGKKNKVSWTSMINGYAVHGSGMEAINIFNKMIGLGLEPNEVTFVAALTACSRCGLVDEATHYFKLMSEKYGILPTKDHFTCIVDLLGRAGKLTEVWMLLEELKATRKNCEKASSWDDVEHASLWGALLAGCSVHGELDLGRKVANKMLESKQQISGSYIALSNLYAASGWWDEVYRVREEWVKEGVLMEPGQSKIQNVALI
ncbi:pentatricopeptide repeat-containing protein At2g13600-like isoform X1 [Curcuma longa]|uniref:pentatricopeptide repeat-containing protein At2g13600-like isoform X1 n=1 Tax=Curcuma longa TaxID=136217 RepID=UPI003D9E6978